MFVSTTWVSLIIQGCGKLTIVVICLFIFASLAEGMIIIYLVVDALC